MKPLTTSEDRAALEQLLAAERVGLATLKRKIAVHRDILQSPPATLAPLEDNAVKSVQVIEYLEAALAGPAPTPLTGPTIPLNE